MSFRVNFFPIPYILVLMLVIAFVVIFNETIYSYFAANFEINGAIVGLFVFCNIWILGALAYYSRNARLLSKMFAGVGPVVERKSTVRGNQSRTESPAVVQPYYTIAGTLFDSPIFSSVLAKLDRKKKLDVSRSDADEITQSILDNALRVLSPSKFIASIFILCGLIGTFFGLLETIGGVASALNSLASGGLTTDLGKFIKLLSDPLQGMSTAFSASLFGLTSALVSNFGNHMAWQRVTLFASKVRNYLLSNTGVFDEDPSRITVRDLLVSLEESFDMLYRGLTNKLEDLTNHIATMGSVIVKTHERQERMLRIIMKDHEIMERFWDRFLLNDRGMKAFIEGISRRLAVILPETMRQVFGPPLADILDTMAANSKKLERALEYANSGLATQANMLDRNEEACALLEEHTNLLSNISNELAGIHQHLNLDQLAAMIADGNDIKQDIAGGISISHSLLDRSNELAENRNAIMVQSNMLSENIIDRVEHNTAAVADVSAAVGENIDVATDIRTLNERSVEMSQEILHNQRVNHEIGEQILTSIDQSNAISGDTLVMVGNMLGETQQLQRDTLNMVAAGVQHSENIIKVLDERFGMMISFSSDLLTTSGDMLSSLMALNESLIRYYNEQYLRLDAINNSVNGVAAIASTGVALADQGVNNLNAIIHRLDQSNEVAANDLEVSNALLSGMTTANTTLDNLFAASSKHFNDTANLSVVYIGMERQINDLLSSFLEFRGNFNEFLNTSNINTNTLSGINALSSEMAERMAVMVTTLNDIVGSLTNLNEISGGHRDLSATIANTVNNILGQSSDLNGNVVTLSEVFNNGISRVIEGIGVIHNSSTNCARVLDNLLEGVVSNLSTLSEVSSKASDILTVNQEHSSRMSDIITRLNDSNQAQQDQISISKELKDILINTDTNVMGIGNVLNDVKDTNTSMNERLRNLVQFNESVSDHHEVMRNFGNNVEKSLQQISSLVNNVGAVYEQYGDDVKSSLGQVITGIEAISQVNQRIASLVQNINQLSDSIDTRLNDNPNGEILQNLQTRLDDLITLKTNMLNAFEDVVAPVLNNLNKNFADVNEYLTELSEIASNNRDVLARMGSADFADKIVARLTDTNNTIADIERHFRDLFGQLDEINEMVGYQNNMFDGLSEEWKSFKLKAKDFAAVPRALQESAEAIASINQMVTSLTNTSEDINDNLGRISNNVTGEVRALATMVTELQQTFKDELGRASKDSSTLYEGINKLINGIYTLGDEVRTGNRLTETTHKDSVKEMTNFFNSISESIKDIKKSLSSDIGGMLAYELDKLSNNQFEIAKKIEQIAPYISELVRLVNDLDTRTVNNELLKIVHSLENVNRADVSNNAKLDLLIKAADTLISEMLNSRSVSQAILDIIAELGGFKKVK